MLSKRNILVTGGAGFIGSHTVVELVKSGFTPYIVDDFRNADKSVIARLDKLTGVKIPVISIDICDKKKLFDELSSIEFTGVIHFAAYKAVGESVDEPLKYYHNNVIGTLNVIQFCNEKQIKNFVFSSSCTVYGEPKEDKAVSESDSTYNANSPYGFTKVVCEQMLRDVHTSGDPLKILVLRYFNPIGAHQTGLIGEAPIGKPNNLIPYVTQTAAGIHEKLTVFGNDYETSDGTCKRDYIHVCDLADAHVKALEFLIAKDAALLEFVNIGTGTPTSTLEVITIFERVSGQKLNWEFGPRRSGDVMEIYANADKAIGLLGWKARYSVEDAVRDAWNWQLKQHDEI